MVWFRGSIILPHTYFSNFKQIEYANNTAIDITQRVAPNPSIKNNIYSYYPIDLSDSVRADTIAYKAYLDPYLSWSLYLANDITDPYYEWYMNAYEFTSFIKNKYGSLQAAQTKIKCWRNDWVDKSTISSQEYYNLTDNQKHYWEQNIEDQYYSVVDYRRKREDWEITTNFVVEAIISLTSSNSFIHDEIIDFADGGIAQVSAYSNNTLMVYHTQGTLSGNITGRESGAQCTITNLTYVSNNISQDLITYWKPITYYDYENEKNESRKSIVAIKTELMPKFVQAIKNVLGS
jgi:hypothetical protein